MHTSGESGYQQLAIDWLLQDSDENPIPNLLQVIQPIGSNRQLEDYGWPGNYLKRHGYPDAVEGLSGLITLGAAWESARVRASPYP